MSEADRITCSEMFGIVVSRGNISSTTPAASYLGLRPNKDVDLPRQNDEKVGRLAALLKDELTRKVRFVGAMPKEVVQGLDRQGIHDGWNYQLAPFDECL